MYCSWSSGIAFIRLPRKLSTDNKSTAAAYRASHDGGQIRSGSLLITAQPSVTDWPGIFEDATLGRLTLQYGSHPQRRPVLWVLYLVYDRFTGSKTTFEKPRSFIKKSAPVVESSTGANVLNSRDGSDSPPLVVGATPVIGGSYPAAIGGEIYFARVFIVTIVFVITFHIPMLNTI